MNLDYLNRPQLEARVRAAFSNARRQFLVGLLLGTMLGLGLVSFVLVVATMAGAP